MTLRPLDYDTQTGFSAGLTHALIQALDPEKLLHRNCTVHTCKSHPKCSVDVHVIPHRGFPYYHPGSLSIRFRVVDSGDPADFPPGSDLLTHDGRDPQWYTCGPLRAYFTADASTGLARRGWIYSYNKRAGEAADHIRPRHAHRTSSASVASRILSSFHAPGKRTCTGKRLIE
ncbi:hypothetical protein BD626DRAFT_57888 [Schizophyllum amplum]|uniref:Uncharacterized protein n=1 Tax=Schizophyllum amplum TaxID=97359 RepID=A0A550CBK2_9AGAR|nr:hypothetical protein BD626DRAFT_57888 [Auriculariopsis ampla]